MRRIMWEVVFLVVCLLLLALHWTTREHLEPSGNIIAPSRDSAGRFYYNQTQRDQIWSNLPESVRAAWRETLGRGLEGDEREWTVKAITVDTLSMYYDAYASASTRITPSDVDQWMTDKGRGGDRERELLITYFVDGANPPPPPPPPPAAEPPPPPPVPEPAPASVTSSPATVPEAPQVPVPTTNKMEIRSPTNITINVR